MYLYVGWKGKLVLEPLVSSGVPIHPQRTPLAKALSSVSLPLWELMLFSALAPILIKRERDFLFFCLFYDTIAAHF